MKEKEKKAALQPIPEEMQMPEMPEDKIKVHAPDDSDNEQFEDQI